MSKKERVKTFSNALIAVTIALMTALFSVLGWAAVNHKVFENDKILMGYVIVGIVILSALCVGAVIWFFKELKKLEKM